MDEAELNALAQAQASAEPKALGWLDMVTVQDSRGILTGQVTSVHRLLPDDPATSFTILCVPVQDTSQTPLIHVLAAGVENTCDKEG